MSSLGEGAMKFEKKLRTIPLSKHRRTRMNVLPSASSAMTIFEKKKIHGTIKLSNNGAVTT
jgi:hypothetical protein